MENETGIPNENVEQNSSENAQAPVVPEPLADAGNVGEGDVVSAEAPVESVPSADASADNEGVAVSAQAPVEPAASDSVSEVRPSDAASSQVSVEPAAALVAASAPVSGSANGAAYGPTSASTNGPAYDPSNGFANGPACGPTNGPTAGPASGPANGPAMSDNRRAWNDLRQSKGWIGRSFLMGLLGIVPVLNFVPLGYARRWGSWAAFGYDASQPKAIFGNRHFVIGFYAFVVLIVVEAILSIINLVPLIGSFVELVLAILVQGPLCAALTYLTITDNLGAAFRVKELWKAMKRDYGGMMAAAWIPSLISLAACILPTMIALGATVLAVFFAYASTGYLELGTTSMGYMSMSYADMGYVGLVWVIAILIIIGVWLCACYIMSVFCFVASMVTSRALGYWTARVMPEWVAEGWQVGAPNHV